MLAAIALTTIPLQMAAAETAKADVPVEASASSNGPAAGAKGLTLGINALPTVGGFYYLSDVGSLRLNLGLNFALKPDADAQFSLGAAYRHHLRTGDLRPYVEGGMTFDFLFDDDVNFALHGGLGAEYFFAPNVSISGTVGLALRFDHNADVISIPFGTTGIQLSVFL
ncbi:outer membrane beta-barrel protein [Myxococcaceae bacterium JPH2]|nr:outer membrane beta-barrel protein [Myxococcaceae bacterium JPH2]